MGTSATAEIDWNRLDKQKFFGVGAVVFTGLTTCLFPLSVIKTRQMALENVPSGIKGAYITARTVVHHDGVRGLYKGFGTVISGAIPARIVYLSTLEGMKSATSSVLQQYKLSDTVNAGMASFVAGGCASLVSQSVIVPVDVVAQRLMIMGGGQQQQQQHPQQPPRSQGPTQPHHAGRQGFAGSAPGSVAGSTALGSNSSSSSSVQQAAQRSRSVGGLQLARQIIGQEGVAGLYRGFWASAATFVPNSAIWWGCYGTYQRLFWHQIDKWRGTHQRTEGEILAVQACAGIITGFTSASLTNPLDVVKTRLQTREAAPGQPRLTFTGVAGQLARSEGVRGFYRGVAPRMISSAVWGTAMVTTYEFLKRLCVLPPEEAEALP